MKFGAFRNLVDERARDFKRYHNDGIHTDIFKYADGHKAINNVLLLFYNRHWIEQLGITAVDVYNQS